MLDDALQALAIIDDMNRAPNTSDISSHIELEKPVAARKRTQADEEPLWRELARAEGLRSGT